MHKKVTYIAIIMFIIMLIFTACNPTQNSEKPQGNILHPLFDKRQHFSQYAMGKDLFLTVEVDKQEYTHREYIYVTARLCNKTEEIIRIHVPNGRGYHHELQTVLTGSDGSLYDVDYAYSYALPNRQPIAEDAIMELMPGEEYIQTMRFSTYMFNNYLSHTPLSAEKVLPAGQYQGIVNARILNDRNVVEELSISFTVNILPEE